MTLPITKARHFTPVRPLGHSLAQSIPSNPTRHVMQTPFLRLPVQHLWSSTTSVAPFPNRKDPRIANTPPLPIHVGSSLRTCHVPIRFLLLPLYVYPRYSDMLKMLLWLLEITRAEYHLKQLNNVYHPRMRLGNVFGRVCLSVCPSVCPSVCLSVQTITFELLHIGNSFLVWRYILTISRSSLSINVIGLRSRLCSKNDYLLISTCYSFVCAYRPLIRSRSHIKVRIKSRSRSNWDYF